MKRISKALAKILSLILVLSLLSPAGVVTTARAATNDDDIIVSNPGLMIYRDEPVQLIASAGVNIAYQIDGGAHDSNLSMVLPPWSLTWSVPEYNRVATITTGGMMTVIGAGVVEVTATLTDGFDTVTGTRDIAVAPRTLTPTGFWTVLPKTFDSTTSAAIDQNLLALDTGIIGGDTVSLDISSATAHYVDANVGSPKTAYLTGVKLLNDDVNGDGNPDYVLGSIPPAQGAITPKELTVSGFTVGNKNYDGNDEAVIGDVTLQGDVAGGVSIDCATAVATFEDKNAGTAKVVTLDLNSLDLTGLEAGNYILDPDENDHTLTASADIFPVDVTFSDLIVDDKYYDGGTAATVHDFVLSGVITGEEDHISLDEDAVQADFAGMEPGTHDVTLNPGSLALKTDDETNYPITNYNLATTSPLALSATINPATATIGGSFTIDPKTYNKSAYATIATNSLSLVGLLPADVGHVDLNPVVGFNAADVASANAVYLDGGSTISGDRSGNYTLDITGAPSIPAAIAPKALTVSGAAAQNKTYDGTTDAAIDVSAATLGGVEPGDDVLLISPGVGAFASVGSPTEDTVVNVTANLQLTGSAAGNYTLTQPTGLSATILKEAPHVTTIDFTPISVATGGTQAFAAVVYDQYGDEMTGEAVTWSVLGANSAGTNIGENTGLLAIASDETATDLIIKATSVTDNTVFVTRGIYVIILPVITTASLTDAVKGVAYGPVTLSATHSATLGWSLATGSTLPAGLTLSENGILSGTPTANAGSYSFTIKAAYYAYPDIYATQLFQLKIAEVTGVTVVAAGNATSLPMGSTLLFSATVMGSSDPVPPQEVIWSLSAHDIGTAISPSGHMTVATGETHGTLTITATSVANPSVSSAGYTVNVTPVPTAPTITTASLPSATRGTAYSQTLAATGYPASFNWAISTGALPSGLTLIPTTGVISGTPTASGSFPIGVTATNTTGDSLEKSLTLTVNEIPVVTTATLPDGLKGTAYSQNLNATGFPASFTWTKTSGTLPGGITLSGTGVLSGTPTESGSFSFTVKATNSVGNDTQVLTLVINAAPEITTASLPGGTVGATYNAALAATGYPAAYTWDLVDGDLPTGVTLSESGAFTGTPTEVGTFTFQVSATNIAGNDTQELIITINPAPTVTDVTVSPAAVAVLKGRTQAFTVAVQGTNSPAQTVTWTVTGGVAGTTINASGLLTVAASETAKTLTVTATSTADNSKSGTATVTVTSPPPITVKYTITATSSSTAYGTVSGGGTFASGASVTLSAKPKAGYQFVSWLEGSKAVSSSAQYTFTATRARTLKAVFERAHSPRSPEAVSAGYDRIKITWSKVTGAKEYEIYRATTKGGIYTKAGVCASTSFTNTGLITSKTYFFKVRAKYVAGSTITYGGYSATVLARAIPAAPSGFKGSVASFNSIRLTWNQVPGATKYVVYRAVNKTGYYAKIAETSSTTYTDKGLTHKKTYYYKVRACLLSGKTKVLSAYSGIVTAKPILGTPASVRAFRIPGASIRVTWGAVSGASGYNVYRSTSKTGIFTLVGSVAGGSEEIYIDKSAKSGQTYYYQVKAYVLAGGKKLQSAPSNTAPVETVR